MPSTSHAQRSSNNKPRAKGRPSDPKKFIYVYPASGSHFDNDCLIVKKPMFSFRYLIV